MWSRFALRVQAWSARYGDSAPAVCCGVCKPCVTTAATGLVVAAAGSTVTKVAGRRSGGEDDAAPGIETAGEPGEDRQLGVQPASTPLVP